MRIAMLTNKITIGGGLEYIYQIARHLSNDQFIVLGKGGDDITLLDKLPNVTVVKSGYSHKTIKKYNVDIIHVNHLRPLLRLLINPFNMPKVPVINTVHGLHVRKYDFILGSKAKLLKFLRSKLEKHLLKLVNENIVLTQDDHDYLSKRYDCDNLTIIPNGIDFDELQKQSFNKAEALSALGIPKYKKLFMTIARFDFPKGIDLLIAAISQIAKPLRDHEAGFVIIGDGPIFATIRSEIEKAGIEDICHLTGAIPNASRYLRACDILVMPSRWEGLPITILEAGGLNLPVVASNTCGINALISNKIDGLLFTNCDIDNMSECLINACTLPQEQLQKYANNLHKKVFSQYTSDIMSNRIRQIYKKHIDKKA